MSEAQVGVAQPREPELTDEQRNDPRFEAARREGAGDKGREALAHAAMGATLDADEEVSAIGWLLGNPQPMVYEVPVDVDTPAGTKKVTFVIKAQDGKLLDDIERKHTNEVTGVVDAMTANAEIVWQATVEMIDETGRSTRLDSDEFLTFPARDERGNESTMRVVDPRIALQRRFRTQMGLLSGVSGEVRRVSGYTRDRVGTAQRRLVTAAGN